jgi:hypothetical protein
LRITPSGQSSRSLGVVVASYLPSGVLRTEAASRGLPGYAAILDGGTGRLPFRSFEAFPTATHMFLGRSQPVLRDPVPQGGASFRWFADDVGELTEHGVQLALPLGASLKVRLEEAWPWRANGLGPEGFISLLRGFPLHWFVYSLGSKAEYSAILPNEDGRGFESISGRAASAGGGGKTRGLVGWLS